MTRFADPGPIAVAQLWEEIARRQLTYADLEDGHE
jgi:hypothetical protein